MSHPGYGAIFKNNWVLLFDVLVRYSVLFSSKSSLIISDYCGISVKYLPLMES